MMNNKVLSKIVICIMVIFIIFNIFNLPKTNASSIGEIFNEGRSFLQSGNSINNTLNITQLQKTSDYIYNILLGIAIMVAIIAAMVLGIQFMVASADEKAKVKEAILPFIVGCIVVFGAFKIWKVAVNIGNNAENGKSVDEQRLENHEQYERIENGEIANFSAEELKAAYTANWVMDDLNQYMHGTAQRPRAKEDWRTLEEAIKNLTPYKREIYNAAKNKGLLKEDSYGNLVQLK